MTSLFSRYMFWQVTNAFLVILLTLTSVVWLATALKELNLITSKGQGMLLFMQMTGLTLPSLVALIAPNAVLMATLYTLDRLNGDSELIVMTAAGAPVSRFAKPFILLASIVGIAILFANVFLNPACMRALRGFITEVRADLISQVIQPGRFSSPETGLTFHIRDRSPGGELLEERKVLFREVGSFLLNVDYQIFSLALSQLSYRGYCCSWFVSIKYTLN